MKKSIVFALVAVAAIVVLWLVSSQRRMVNYQEKATMAWSQVESAYQRRMDLIPNLVSTVQGAADYEKSVLTAVIEARAKASSVQIDADNLTEDNIAQFQQAQDALQGAMNRAITLTVERYPEITATKNFSDLQTQIEGTENRINVEREKFNEAVRPYNTMIRQFPNNLAAKILGFEKMGYFKSAAGAENAPSVDFNFD